ncbi:MAG: hypothetical protein KTR31_08825 [Myxococcales bacterium]|nr:hypothetical protein [Myxococcales bacterium]
MSVPGEAGTVSVHVQVIDLQPRMLEMVVPTYLDAEDLAQRVARDAGLGAYWEDGTRRAYYLRARGRLLQRQEKLQELGIVAGELLHLLPEPPREAALAERPPTYPEARGYPASGTWAIGSSLTAVVAFTLGWAGALSVNAGPVVALLPGVGLSLLCTGLARHLWGGRGSSVRVPLTAMGVFLPLLVLAHVLAVPLGALWSDVALAAAGAVVAGAFGVLLGWLAWFGAVEALPEVSLKEIREAESMATWPCGICGNPVTVDLRSDCGFGCGRVFHKGCHEASLALAPDSSQCGVCGFAPPS